MARCSLPAADLPGAEEMIGLFLDTVPVRVQLAEDAGLWPWLRDIQRAQRQREAHGHVAMSDLQGWAGFQQQGDPQHGAAPATPAALFDSLLIVETYPETIEATVARDGAGLRLSATGMRETTNFPLVVKLLPGAAPTLVLTADAARIPSAALPRLAGHLLQVLQTMARGADIPLGAIEILSDAEAAELAAIGEGPGPALPADTLAQLLARACEAPDAPALRTPEGAVLSRQALMARAGQIATALRTRGIGRGDVVAVCQDRTPDLLATLIAAWRCGAAYLPLDPSYPAERIAYILADANVSLMVADPLGREAVGALDDLPLVMLAECTAAPAALPDRVEPEDLAYILYTSGSTGGPKACRSHIGRWRISSPPSAGRRDSAPMTDCWR